MQNKLKKLSEYLIKIIKENKYYILLVLITLFVFNFEFPYTIEMPGGFISLNSRISIPNESEESGEFGMAYVAVSRATIPTLIISYFDNNWDTYKNDEVTLENETLSDSNARSKLYQKEALANATYVAYKSASKDVTITDTKLYIGYVEDSSSLLKVNDEIIRMNGVEVNSLEDIYNAEQIDTDTINIDVIRNNEELNLTVSLKTEDDRKIMGVLMVPNYDIETDPEITFKNESNESGPSGGLMMTLSIYDKLTGEDLTKGDKIIGTGTISQDGTVGSIGGVKYKLIGAVKKHAKVFICPEDNYDEAVSVAEEHNYDITIVKVKTFADAVAYLRSR